MCPSQTSGYPIGTTFDHGGNGAVVKAFAAACRAAGLKAGFYLWMPRPTSAGEDSKTVACTQLHNVQTWDEERRVHRAGFHEICKLLL